MNKTKKFKSVCAFTNRDRNKHLKLNRNKIFCFFCGIRLGSDDGPRTEINLNYYVCPQCLIDEFTFLEHTGFIRNDRISDKKVLVICLTIDGAERLIQYKRVLDQFNS